MKFYLQRNQFRSDGVFGEILNEKFEFVAVTLEHSYTAANDPKMINGEYKCVRGMHALKSFFDDKGDQIKPSFETFEIENVPGHKDILFHVGNYEDDSEGCVLIGQQIGHKIDNGLMIMNSKKAFESFMKLLEGVDSFDLIVSDCKSN